MMDVFVPTIRRSSLRFCLKSLRKAGCSNPHIVKHMFWVDACNHMALACTSSWFLRVDEDMFICKWSLSFISELIEANPSSGMVSCNLYDWKTRSSLRGIKAYRADVARELGFRADDNGRVDKLFSSRLAEKGISAIISDVVVGVHAHTPDQEQVKSWRMRGEKSHIKYDSLTGQPCNYREQMIFLENIQRPDHGKDSHIHKPHPPS